MFWISNYTHTHLFNGPNVVRKWTTIGRDWRTTMSVWWIPTVAVVPVDWSCWSPSSRPDWLRGWSLRPRCTRPVGICPSLCWARRMTDVTSPLFVRPRWPTCCHPAGRSTCCRTIYTPGKEKYLSSNSLYSYLKDDFIKRIFNFKSYNLDFYF